MPSYYPVCLDLTHRDCLVIGGGGVAERKILSLLEAGAFLRVISPQVTDRIRQLAEDAEITLNEREYRSGDLEGAFLVISATNCPSTNASITEEAGQRNTLLNVVDFPAECNFIVPASVVRGHFMISISTSGKSPALAKKTRKKLQREYGAEYGPLLDILGICREIILDRIPDIKIRKRIFEHLTDAVSPEMVRDENISRIMDSIRRIWEDVAEHFPSLELEAGIRKIIQT